MASTSLASLFNSLISLPNLSGLDKTFKDILVAVADEIVNVEIKAGTPVAGKSAITVTLLNAIEQPLKQATMFGLTVFRDEWGTDIDHNAAFFTRSGASGTIRSTNGLFSIKVSAGDDGTFECDLVGPQGSGDYWILAEKSHRSPILDCRKFTKVTL